MEQTGTYNVERRRSGYSLGWHRKYQQKVLQGSRGQVSAFSSASRRRLSRYIGNCCADYQFLATLTVRDWVPDGTVFKKQLDRFLVWFMRAQRRSLAQEGGTGSDPELCSILWWLEFQKRGAPHVHFLYTNRVWWQNAAAAWSRSIEDPGAELTATRFEKIKDPQAMPAYVGKYAAKWEQKAVPVEYHDVGRFWGIRGYRLTSVATLSVEQGALQQDLEKALLQAISIEQTAGRCSIYPWKFGEGISIYPERGYGDLEHSGVIARLELEIAKTLLQGGDYVVFEPYRRIEGNNSLHGQSLQAQKSLQERGG